VTAKVPGTLAALATLLCVASSAWAADPAHVVPDTASTIAQADRLYDDRSNVTKDLEALALYEKAIQATPDNASLYWKAARACWWAGTRSKGRSERLKLFDRGITFGKQAVEKKSDAVEPHFWLGSNYASYGHDKGAFTSLSSIKRIRQEMALTIKYDQSYLYGGADRVLGILDYLIPGFIGGDRARALAHFQKALSYAPDHPVTQFYLADYYAEGKQYAEARKTLSTLNGMNVPVELEPEWEIIIPERDTLEKKLKAAGF
jgi:tetratricopeptide (TPR) repeat protein